MIKKLDFSISREYLKVSTVKVGRQSGENGLKLSNIKKDYELLVRVKSDVDEFIEELLNNKEEYKDLIEELEKNTILE